MTVPIDQHTRVLPATPAGLQQAADLLRAGALVAFATETVYGLGADARNDRAVAAIFAAKGRPRFNPLIVHLADAGMAARLADLPPQACALAELWPGPLSLVLPLRPGHGLSPLVTAGLDTVALRVPAHPLARALLASFGGPVAAPSANPSGRVSPTTAAHVLAGLSGRIAAVLDGGPCAVGLESTIVGFEGERAVLLRPGGISVEEIEARLGAPLLLPQTGAGITAPGQLSAHYAPGVPMRLDAAHPAPDEIWIGLGPLPGGAQGISLSPTGDLTEAAAMLFGALHSAAQLVRQSGAQALAVGPVPEQGLGRAINDRLRRAAVAP